MVACLGLSFLLLSTQTTGRAKVEHTDHALALSMGRKRGPQKGTHRSVQGSIWLLAKKPRSFDAPYLNDPWLQGFELQETCGAKQRHSGSV